MLYKVLLVLPTFNFIYRSNFERTILLLLSNNTEIYLSHINGIVCNNTI